MRNFVATMVGIIDVSTLEDCGNSERVGNMRGVERRKTNLGGGLDFYAHAKPWRLVFRL